MNLGNILAFVVFPYIALTTFVIGHFRRYLTDRYGWNARSSEFLEKKRLLLGVTLFHWGILLVLLGHIGGLLIPQRLFDLAGINSQTHTLIAHYSGMVAGGAALLGLCLLLARRLSLPRIRLSSSQNDVITVLALIFVVGSGLYNVLFAHYNILESVAPWIRSIVTLTPAPSLMLPVPLSYKIHVLSALALLAFSPFSRLIHIWSAPIGYFFRSWIVFRRKVAQ